MKIKKSVFGLNMGGGIDNLMEVVEGFCLSQNHNNLLEFGIHKNNPKEWILTGLPKGHQIAKCKALKEACYVARCFFAELNSVEMSFLCQGYSPANMSRFSDISALREKVDAIILRAGEKGAKK